MFNIFVLESVNLNEIYRIYLEEALKKIHSCCQILLRKRANCFTFYLKMKRNTRFQSGSIWKSFLLMFIADVHTNDALMEKIYYIMYRVVNIFAKDYE